MPISVQMPLPGTAARRDILAKQLRSQGEQVQGDAAVSPPGTEEEGSNAAGDVNSATTSSASAAAGASVAVSEGVTPSILDDLAERTEGYSGSDLRELVRVAILQRNKQLMDYVLGEEEKQQKQLLLPPVGASSLAPSAECDSSAQDGLEAAGCAKDDSNSSSNSIIDGLMSRPLCEADFEEALRLSTPTGTSR